MHKQNLSAYFLSFISVSALFFLIGLTVCYILSPDSRLFSLLENNVVSSVISARSFDIFTLSASFADELKYLLFIFVTTFCVKRLPFFCLVSAYKGFTSGVCSAIFLRAVKIGAVIVRFKSFGCMLFIVFWVANLCILCYTCASAMIYSKSIIYPPKFKSLLKRKDTIKFLFNFLALCGASFLIILLKHGNLFMLISTKGL